MFSSKLNQKYYNQKDFTSDKGNVRYIRVDSDYITSDKTKLRLSTKDVEINLNKIIEQKIATTTNIAIAKNHILSLKDNWDNRESPKFIEETFSKVESLVMNLFTQLRTINVIPPPPQISPSSGGCIEILYDTSSYEILLQISEDNTCIMSGEVFNVAEVDAEISLKLTVEFIKNWLKQMKVK